MYVVGVVTFRRYAREIMIKGRLISLESNIPPLATKKINRLLTGEAKKMKSSERNSKEGKKQGATSLNVQIQSNKKVSERRGRALYGM